MQMRPQMRPMQSPSQGTRDAPKTSLRIVSKNNNEQSDPSERRQDAVFAVVATVLIVLVAAFLWYINYYDTQRYNSDTLAGASGETSTLSQTTAPGTSENAGAGRSAGTSAPAYSVLHNSPNNGG